MFKVAYKTDIGQKRTTNQDTIRVNESHGLCIVADGMGGYKGGEIASEMAVEIVESILTGGNPYENVEEWIHQAIAEANKSILLKAITESDYKGMGTTCSLIFIYDDELHIGHVGDSRVYFINNQQIEQITKDHTLVEEMVAKGQLTQAEAKVHPKRNVITRAVGSDPSVVVDYMKFPLKDIDKLMICSDGLTGCVDDSEINEIINTYTIQEAVIKLIDLANERGGIDNISVIIMKLEE